MIEKGGKMEKIIVAGRSLFCSAFKLAGVETIEIVNENEFLELLNRRKNDVSIIVVEEEVYREFSNKTKKMLANVLKPAVISLSLSGESEGESLEQLMKRALGITIK